MTDADNSDFMKLSPDASAAVQRAIRMSVVSGAEDDSPETIQASATECLSEVLSQKKKDGSISELRKQVIEKETLQGAAISVAALAVTGAFEVLTEEWETAKWKRNKLRGEIQKGVAKFAVPESRDNEGLSREQLFMRDYINLSMNGANPWLKRYLGIRKKPEPTESGKIMYYVMPFYKMTAQVPQPAPDLDTVQSIKVCMNRFLNSKLSEDMAHIKEQFMGENAVLSTVRSLWKGGDYLNNWRVPRFLMMSLSNLLWSLEEIYDIDGRRLDLDECVKRCEKVENFLIDILNKEKAPFIDQVSNQDNQLRWFVTNILNYVRRLRFSYMSHQLTQLRFTPLIDGGYRSLRALTDGVFQILYKQDDKAANRKVSDKIAVDMMSTHIDALNTLIGQSDAILSVFRKYARGLHATVPFLNKEVTTVIDLLIVFCHMPESERAQVISELQNSKQTPAQDAAITLKKFKNRFIAPIEGINPASKVRKVLKFFEFGKCKPSTAAEKAKAKSTGQRLIPIITLLAESLQLDVDTQQSSATASNAASPSTEAGSSTSSSSSEGDIRQVQLLSGKQQVQFINKQAHRNTVRAVEQPEDVSDSDSRRKYYVWHITPFVAPRERDEASNIQFDRLPLEQYRLLQITTLIKSIDDLLKSYDSYLKNKRFQKFLKHCLAQIKAAYVRFDSQLDGAEAMISGSSDESIHMQSILRPIIGLLNDSLRDFEATVSYFEGLVNDPSFVEKDREHLTDKLIGIDELYRSLFAEPSGIREVLPAALKHSSSRMSQCFERAASPTSASIMSLSTFEDLQAFTLENLCKQCLDSMSIWSRNFSNKGNLLRGIISEIQQDPLLDDERIKCYLRDLVRVVASYRKTWFFQAEYGETRSAQALIRAIRSPDVNLVLPVKEVLFGHATVDLDAREDSEVVEKMKGIRDDKSWEESEDLIEAAGLETSPALA